MSQPVPISAWGGAIAWSEPDPSVDCGEDLLCARYRLLIHRDGRTEVAPVPLRTGAFDVDLGPGPGGLTAAYSRCDGVAPSPCRLVLYDVATATEQPLPSFGGYEGRPVIWGDRIAYSDGDGNVLTRRLGPGSRPARVSTGGRCLPNERCDERARRVLLGHDLEGSVLATTWSIPGAPVDVSSRGRGNRSQRHLRVGTIDGRARTVAIARGMFTRPSIARGVIQTGFKEAAGPRGASAFVRYDLRRRRLSRAPAPHVLAATAFDGTTTVALHAPFRPPSGSCNNGFDPGACPLVVLAPPTFRDYGRRARFVGSDPSMPPARPCDDPHANSGCAPVRRRG